MIRHALLFLLLMSVSISVPGVDQILVRDDFDSYAGSQLPVTGDGTLSGGTGWSTVPGDWGWFIPTGLATRGIVTSPSLGSASGMRLETEDVGSIGRRFRSMQAPTASSPVWMTFALKGVQLPETGATPGGNNNSVQFLSGNWTGTGIVFSLNTLGTLTTSGKIRWRLNTTDNPSNQNEADNSVHLVVVKVMTTTITAWFDPSLGLAEPDPSNAIASISASTPSFDRLLITSAKSTSGNPILTAVIGVDSLRIGNSWKAVSDIGMPTVTSIGPVTGSTIGGTNVSILGTNLDASSSVTLGGVPASSVTWVSASQIVAQTPAGSAGTVDVVVSGPTASAYLSDGFTYAVGSAGNPVPITGPIIFGAARPGASVSADAGTWNPPQSSFSYQWTIAPNATALASNIPSATSATYTVVEADLGKYLRVRVNPASVPANTVDSASVLVAIEKPNASTLSALEAIGPRCGAGGALAVAVGATLLLVRRRRG